jgi:EmrB/QacA subfamily drug resistance transporter
MPIEGLSSDMRVTSALPSAPQHRTALWLLCGAAFMAIVDASAVTVALPSMRRGLGLSPEDLQWVLSGYSVTLAGLLLVGGRMADLLGGRRMFLLGAVTFAGASALCGLAWDGSVLVAARVAQGAAGAAMVPAGMSLLVNMFEEGAARNRALGIWGTVSALGGTAGWVVGGPITTGLGWRWIFFINLPVAAAVIALGPGVLQPSRGRNGARHRPDIAGTVTVTGALLLLVNAVPEIPQVGWADPRSSGALVLAAALLAAFVLIEARSSHPLVPLRLFRSRTLAGGCLLALCVGMIAFGQGFVLTQYVQQVLGYSTLVFGVTAAVLPVAAALGSFASQAMVTRIGCRWTGAIGCLIGAAGGLLLAQVSGHGSYLADVLLPLGLLGLGIGIIGVASSIVTMSRVSRDDTGVASGVQNASFQLGGGLGVAVLASFLASGSAAEISQTGLVHGTRTAFTAVVCFAAVGLLSAFFAGNAGRRHGAVLAERASAVP